VELRGRASRSLTGDYQLPEDAVLDPYAFDAAEAALSTEAEMAERVLAASALLGTAQSAWNAAVEVC